jgi:hypothetical protein
MGVLFVDSMPYSSPSSAAPKKWTYVDDQYGGVSVETAAGRFGGRWLYLREIYGTDHNVRKTFGGSESTIMLQFGFQVVFCDRESNIVRFMDTLTPQVYFTYTTGIIKAYRGDGILLATGATPITAGVWHQFEIKIVVDNSAGSIILKVDGNTLINASALDTQYTANAIINGFELWCSGGSGQGYSDIILMDTTGDYCNDLLGARMVELKVPTADGHYSQFKPSTSPGSNYAMVDEVPPDGDTTYNTGDVDDVDTFTKDPISNPTATVDAVVCSIYAKTNDGGSASVKGIARSGGREVGGTELPVPSSYDHLQSIIYVDPNTAAQFTAAGINAAELGYKRSA